MLFLNWLFFKMTIPRFYPIYRSPKKPTETAIISKQLANCRHGNIQFSNGPDADPETSTVNCIRHPEPAYNPAYFHLASG